MVIYWPTFSHPMSQPQISHSFTASKYPTILPQTSIVKPPPSTTNPFLPPQTHAIDTSSVIEAHGLLTSLLVENDLPQHVTDTLRRVAKILDPTPTTGTPMLARMLTRANQFGLKTDSDPSSDCEEELDEDGKPVSQEGQGWDVFRGRGVFRCRW